MKTEKEERKQHNTGGDIPGAGAFWEDGTLTGQEQLVSPARPRPTAAISVRRRRECHQCGGAEECGESPREINENTPMVVSGLSGNEERSSPCGCNEMKYYTTNEQYSCDMDEEVTRQKTRTCVVLLRSSQRPGGGVATDVLVVNQLPVRCRAGSPVATGV